MFGNRTGTLNPGSASSLSGWPCLCVRLCVCVCVCVCRWVGQDGVIVVCVWGGGDAAVRQKKPSCVVDAYIIVAEGFPYIRRPPCPGAVTCHHTGAHFVGAPLRQCSVTQCFTTLAQQRPDLRCAQSVIAQLLGALSRLSAASWCDVLEQRPGAPPIFGVDSWRRVLAQCLGAVPWCTRPGIIPRRGVWLQCLGTVCWSSVLARARMPTAHARSLVFSRGSCVGTPSARLVERSRWPNG